MINIPGRPPSHAWKLLERREHQWLQPIAHRTAIDGIVKAPLLLLLEV